MSDEQKQEEEYTSGLMEMDRSSEIGVAAFFLSTPLLVGAAELLHMGFSGLVIGTVGAGAVGLVGKHLLEKEEVRGRLSRFSVLERLRNANWGALLESIDEQGKYDSPASPQPALPPVEQSSEEMQFGPTLHPTANLILSGRKVLFGVSDAGKSNNIAVIAEEIGGPGYGVPLFLLDTEDEYRKLVDKKYLTKPVWIDRNKLPPEQAFAFAQWAVHDLRQVVINLQSYEDAEAAWLMIGLIKGVQAYQEGQEARIPCEFILDEAAVWLPQNPSQSTLSKVMVDDPDGNQDEEGKQVSLLSLLERAFFSVIVRRGRKRGMGFTLATQRPAEVNKSALQANWLFLMKQTQPADWQVYKQFGIKPEDALSLKAGETFVFAPGKPMERHRFRLRKSPHGAKTPGLSELRQHQQHLAGQPAQPQPVMRQLSIVLPVEEEEEDAELAGIEVDTELSEREQLYDRALQAWEQGARSIRTMQQALDLNFNEARELMEEMNEQGLIPWRAKSHG
ncbi:MAG: hypothetical protein J2P37_34340 [Ktedonobacteraceae bacterium]|nr:hypothetical protein [Ktedonobacteraceae bacterium]